MDNFRQDISLVNDEPPTLSKQSPSSSIQTSTKQTLNSNLEILRLEIQKLEKEIELENLKKNHCPPTYTCNVPKSTFEAEVPIFDGDPMDYSLFIKRFSSILAKPYNDDEKLSLLYQSCKGRAKEAITSCLFLEPSAALPEALSNLQKRFGQSDIIARVSLDKLLNWPKIRISNSDDLFQLVDYMRICQRTLTDPDYNFDLNALLTIRTIVSKLPASLQESWAEYIASREINRKFLFMELITFLEQKANMATLAYSWKSSNIDTFPSSVNAYNPSEKACLLCSESHYLDKCPKFINMPSKDRISYAQRNKLCYFCLKANHVTKDCKRRNNNPTGNSKHHYLLSFEQNENIAHQLRKQTSPNTTHVNSTSKSGDVLLPVIPVMVKNNDKTEETYALLDNASDITLIHKPLADKLGIRGKSSDLTVETVTGICTTKSEKVNFQLLPIEKGEALNVYEAQTIEKLPTIKGANRVDLSKYAHLRDVYLQRPHGDQVKILIGCDVPEAHEILEQRMGKSDEPIGIKTKFGWTLCGPNRHSNVSHTFCTCTDNIENMFTKLYNQDAFGDSLNVKGMSVNDKLALNKMNSSVRFITGHYEVALPWKEPKYKLPNNYWYAKKRLDHLRSKLTRDESLHKRYTETINNYIQEGYAERVSCTTLTDGWFLPHHAVINSRKPEKIRVVFDCAAQCQNISLNDALLTGPDLNNSLFGVLLRFRRCPIAVTADIESMFHQVKVPEADRNYFKFLWWPGGRFEEEPEVYRMTVHLFGATSSPSCAALALKRTIADSEHQFSKESVRIANEQFYVDDLLMSVDTVEEALTFAKELKHLTSLGGFNLTKWNSNSTDVIGNIMESQKNTEMNLIMDSNTPHKALGLKWNLPNDSFYLESNSLDVPKTRRNMLSLIASIYDPLGLVSPMLVSGKVILQETHRMKLDWDKDIQGESFDRWCTWVKGLSRISTLSIPRCIRPNSLHSQYQLELHCFSDASEVAYGAAIYARLIDKYNRIHCTLLSGKSRVAPIKMTTIPRLELMAALLSTKLGKQVELELKHPISSITFWTDSNIVLHYIRNTTRRFDTFISHRISSIHANSETHQWKYVNTKNNPADLASRGISPLDSKKVSFWFNGPDFLHQPNSEWVTENLSNEAVEETRKVRINVALNDDTFLNSLSKFSSWPRMQHVVGWCLRFTENLKRKVNGQPLNTKHLSAEELECSTNTIIRIVQQSEFPGELNQLECFNTQPSILKDDGPIVLLEDVFNRNEKSGEPYVDPREVTRRMRTSSLKSSSLRALKPFVWKGLLRVGGRLSYAPISFKTRHPIILPKNQFVTKLIIDYYHLKNEHAGVNYTMSQIRKDYWIVNCHAVVSRSIRNCSTCKRYFAKPCSQLMSSLPVERVDLDSRPFTNVGIDYFGPIAVKIGRHQEKRYGCLFTCLTTRAVHIEVSHTLSTDSFICAFHRFISRRGTPKKIYSDSATNFKGAEFDVKLMLQSWNREKISRVLLDNGCDWAFNPPKASHRGGSWERIIGLIKRLLTTTLQRSTPTEEILSTTLVRIENILNERPLTKFVSNDADFIALTPNMLLLPYQEVSTVMNETFEECYSRKWKEAQRCCIEFWKRFKLEYIPILQRRSKWLNYERNLKEDDVVLLVDKEISRRDWKLGRIIRVSESIDGCVRKVWVKTKDGEFERDVRNLCLLEGSSASSSSSAHGREC